MSFQETSPKLHPALDAERSSDLLLPVLPPTIKKEILDLGWVGVGIMVAIITPDEDIMMLIGRETPKYKAGTLGPLGETSKQIEGTAGIPPLVEQPLSTLYRGFSEELGLTEPEHLGLRMKSVGGWAINQWPRGDEYPNQWNCAISFAVHISSDVQALLLDINPQNDEVAGIRKVAIEQVLGSDERLYRQGVQPWLRQLVDAGLTSSTDPQLETVDFGTVIIGHKDIQIDDK